MARLATFGLIIVAIVQKNRPRKAKSVIPAE